MLGECERKIELRKGNESENCQFSSRRNQVVSRTHSSITPVAEVHTSVACCKTSISHPFKKSLISQNFRSVSSAHSITSRERRDSLPM